MDTGPHTLDLLFQVFDSLTLKAAFMDAPIAEDFFAIEANCQLILETDDGLPVELTLSRNRNLSNKAYFQFERARIAADVRDNTLDLALGDGCEVQCMPFGARVNPMTFSDLFDSFYSRFLLASDNRGVSVSETLPAMRIIDDAYALAAPMKVGF